MEPQADWMEIYHNGWSTNEEWDWTTIWEDMAGQFWVFKTAYNVYTGQSDVMTQVNELTAIQEMVDAEEHYSE